MMRIREVTLATIHQGDQLIRDNPEDDSIGELAESIAKHGLLQPIGVRLAPDDTYQLLWGDRRSKAALRLNWEKITAHVYDETDEPVKAVALVENLQRQDLTFAEEVAAVTHMNEVDEMSVERISAALSKSRSWVQNRLMVPGLPEFLKAPLLEGDLPISHLEIIAKIPDEGAQRYLVTQAIINKWNRSSLKTIADCYMTPTPAPGQPITGISGIAPNSAASPFLYTCEMCGEKGQIEEFTLVRIHKDGYACRTVTDRPDNESHSINGLDGNTDQHPGKHDSNPDRKN